MGGPRESGVRDSIEAFLIKMNRGKFHSTGNRSQSCIAAKEALKIFRLIIDRTHEGERGCRPQEMLARVTKIGMHLQRAPAFRLLLANLTRRVLLIVREAAVANQRTAVAMGGDLSELAGDDEIDAAAAESEGDGDAGGDEELPLSPLGAGKGRFPAVADTCGMGSGEGTSDIFYSNNSFFTPEAHAAAAATPPTDVSLPRIPSMAPVDKVTSVHFGSFKGGILKALEELSDEIDEAIDVLCEAAPNHIYTNETILTYGCSHTVLRFLKTVADAKRFHVLALQAEPHGAPAPLVEELAPMGVRVDIVPDSAAYALMGKVQKVFLSTDAVLANGGLLAPSGSLMVCLAAKHYSVPVVVVTTALKITPYFPSDSMCTSLVKMSATNAMEMLWPTFGPPSAVLPVPHHTVHDVTALVFNPIMEYVDPDFVSLFITNEGEFTPTFIHRFLKDQYHAEDAHI